VKTYRRRLNEARRSALELFRPPQRMPLSDYIEKTVNLPAGLSAVPGPIKLWPYQRGICDALTQYERVSVIKGARLGWSTLLAGVVGYYSRIDPTSILCVLPTQEDARTFVISQLESVFAVSPELRDAIPITRTGPHGHFDTMRFRRFPGGSLRVVASRSGRELRAVSARVLIVDECDAMTDIPEEGAPILLAEKRTASWPDRRILAGSTPTNTESYIHQAFLAGDQRVYECPCPSCGTYNEIRWQDIRWDEGRPETARWCCPSCGVYHDESYKRDMVENGRWRALRPEMKNHASFRLSCLIALHGSPVSWPTLATEFVAAKRRPESLRTFINTILGETFDEESDGASPHELQALAEPISLDNIDPSILYLTSSVDVQTGGNGRLEVTTCGFSEDDHWYVLDHRVFYGDPMREEAWAELRDFLAERYPHPLGETIGRDATCIDAGDGNMMNRVLAFTSGNRSLRLIAVKGASGSRPPLTPSASKRTRSLQIMGVDSLKLRLFDRLSRKTGITFSDQLPLAFYEQVLSEKQVVRYSRGRPTRVYERVPGRNAEGLDCCVMCLAARSAVNIPSPRREAELSNRPVSKPMPTVIRSAYLGR
jgi:phage terminase large subunit GpA-like protein